MGPHYSTTVAPTILLYHRACCPMMATRHRLPCERAKRRLLRVGMPNRDPAAAVSASVVPRYRHRPQGNLAELCCPRSPVPYCAPQVDHWRAGRELTCTSSCLPLATGSCPLRRGSFVRRAIAGSLPNVSRWHQTRECGLGG